MTKHEKINSLIKDIEQLKPAPAKKHYEYEYNQFYGGYRLVLVDNKSGGQSGCFGGNGCEKRLTYGNFINKLNTIINTLK